VQIDQVPVCRAISHFDLSLELTPSTDTMRATLQYSSELFAADSIRRMAGHFNQLLAAVARDPDTAICDLPLLTPWEHRELLVDRNLTATNANLSECVTDMFARCVTSAPQAVAVEFEGAHLTYGELDSRSNQLARLLRQANVGPEVRVGLVL